METFLIRASETNTIKVFASLLLRWLDMHFIADEADEVFDIREEEQALVVRDAETPALKWINPKSKRDKRMCQVSQSVLEGIISEGNLTFILVTVLPHPKRKIEEAWAAIPGEREQLLSFIAGLPGCFSAVIALETHGGAHAKESKKVDKRKGAPSAEAQAATADEQDVQGVTAGAEQEKANPKGELAGLPHIHVLLYYPALHSPPLDKSYLKREILTRWGASDVNEKKLADNKQNSMPDYVRTFTYMLKGVNCPATAQYWRAYVNKDTSPPMPLFIACKTWEQDSSCERRWMKLLTMLPEYCETSIPLTTAAAPALLELPPKLDKATLAMNHLATFMQAHTIFVDEAAEHDSFFTNMTIDETVFKHTYVRKWTFPQFINYITRDQQMADICQRFYKRLKDWFNFAVFIKVSLDNYLYIELLDSIYNVRTGEYLDSATFTGGCFNAYKITKEQMQNHDPTEWLLLIDHLCKPQEVRLPGKRPQFNQLINREELLSSLATLLRPRPPKQYIPYIWGPADSGKSSVVMWIKNLYPGEAIAFLNDSCAGLSGIDIRKAVIFCDEFEERLIPLGDLKRLTDGSTGLVLRELHKNARYESNVTLPMVFMANHMPHYKEDDGLALAKRFKYFWCGYLLKRDIHKARAIVAETPFIVAYLNRYRDYLDRIEEANDMLSGQ